MKFIVVGLGSIGKRHLKNLIHLKVPKENIIGVDTRDDRLDEVRALGVDTLFKSHTDALNQFDIDAAILCSPTNLHISQGIDFAKKGTHLMIEKPLSSDLNDIEIFKDEVSKNNVQVLMAYIFRFSPLTIKIKEIIESNKIGKILSFRGEFSEYLPDWHKYEDYRSFYMAKKSQGGGSILDQSHIFDLAHYLFGNFKDVFAFNSKISSLEIDADDIAELIVTMESGVIGSLHTDIFGRKHKKYMEIKGEGGNLLWDFYSNSISLYDSNNSIDKVYDNFESDFNKIYINEMKHFIACCNRNEEPIASLNDGIDTMKLILSAEKSHNSKQLESIN